jgi:hypothetical protein
MNKKVALVTLIEASVLLSDEDKLALLDRVPALNDKQVTALGKFLAAERQFALDHEDDIRRSMEKLMGTLDLPEKKTVFIGSGKPQD